MVYALQTNKYRQGKKNPCRCRNHKCCSSSDGRLSTTERLEFKAFMDALNTRAKIDVGFSHPKRQELVGLPLRNFLSNDAFIRNALSCLSHPSTLLSKTALHRLWQPTKKEAWVFVIHFGIKQQRPELFGLCVEEIGGFKYQFRIYIPKIALEMLN